MKIPLIHVKISFHFQDILTFCPDFFGHAGKRLDQKAQVNFKISDVTDWETISYNIRYPIFQEETATRQWWFKRNIFLEKSSFFLKSHAQNVVRKLVSNPFTKALKLSINLTQQSQMLYSLFYCISKWRSTKNLLTTCFDLI